MILLHLLYFFINQNIVASNEPPAVIKAETDRSSSKVICIDKSKIVVGKQKDVTSDTKSLKGVNPNRSKNEIANSDADKNVTDADECNTKNTNVSKKTVNAVYVIY